MRSRRKKFFLAIFFLGVILALIAAKKNINIDLLEVKEVAIIIKESSCVTEDQVREVVDLAGKNIWSFKDEDIASRTKLKYPCVKEVLLEKQFPSNVKVVIQGRVPKVKVASFEGVLDLKTLEASPSSTSAILNWSFPSVVKDSFLVDETGFLFGSSGEAALPMLFIEESLNIGKSIDSTTFSKITEIVNKIGEIRDSRGTRGKVVGSDLLIDGKPRVAFSLDRDIFRSLASLQLILNKAKIDGNELEVIDLRFDKPVVMYTPKKSKIQK